MKKVLVTGASGFLGGKLCHALIEQGYFVRAFVRKTSDLSCLPSSTADGALELAYGDVTDIRSLIEACSGCDVIFHSAALVEPWFPHPARFISVNVGGLKNVIEAFKEVKTMERIIYTSSFFAIGPTDGYVADETQVHHEKFFCSEYEKSKVIADKIALQAASDGVPIIPVYPGVIYGPGKVTSGNVLLRMLSERFNGRLPGYVGSGNDRHSFSHVDDVVQGHIGALTKGRPGEKYLLTGENASVNQALDLAAVITETKRPLITIPLWVIEAYSWICIVVIYRVTGNMPVINPPAVNILKHQWAYSCEKAKAELGYKPRSLKDGLSEVMPWLKIQGYINY